MITSKLYTLRRIALTAVAILFAFSTSVAADANRPNIILCMADDQGYGDVGYYNTSIAKTPVLDEMAAAGVRFDRFYAAAPVCSPTRGSVLTGRHPNRFGCFSWGHALRPSEVTVAEALQQAGYATGHFGKWHLGSVDPRSDISPGKSGFDRWFSSPNFYENNPLMCANGEVVRTAGEGSMVTVDAAIEFIRSCRENEQPFLAVIWFGSPHNPHEATDELRALFPDVSPALQHYYGEIAGIDRAMGKLRDELRALDVADNTLLWYTSDNGPQGPLRRNPPGSAGGLRDRKGTTWEGGIRVPAIIEWPARFPQYRIIDTPCGTIDIYPTVLSIAGVTIDDQPELDGIDILPIAAGETSTRKRGMGFWDYPTPGLPTRSTELLEELEQSLAANEMPESLVNDAAARQERIDAALQEFEAKGYLGHAAWIDGDWKLHRMQSDSEPVRYELYNLKIDPAETMDVAGENSQRTEGMKEALDEWQRAVVGSLRE